MRSLRYLFLLMVIVATPFATTVRPTYACSCIMPLPPLESMANATAVFEGELAAEPVQANQGIAYTFSVSQVWKGEVTQEVTIRSEGDSAMCGVSFQAGQAYIVYANEMDGALSTNLCTRTAPVASAGEDLTALGEGQPPLPGDGASESPGETPVDEPVDEPGTTETDNASAGGEGFSIAAWGAIAAGLLLLFGVPALVMQRREG